MLVLALFGVCSVDSSDGGGSSGLYAVWRLANMG